MSTGTEDGREKDLLQLVGRGDEKAFKELYERLHRPVYFFILRIVKDAQTAEEVLVDVFTEVWRKSDRFKGKSKVKTWLFGIARNMSLNAMRRNRRHDSLDDHLHVADGGPPVDGLLADKVMVQKALHELSVKHREVLDLVFFHGFLYHEIAEILKIPVSTVKTRVHYGKEALKQILRDMGVNENDVHA